MVCHMHQPNVFVNSYFGYTMWDYESDAPPHVAEEAALPDRRRARRDPRPQPRGGGGRAASGATASSSQTSATLNPKLKDTQFADYHGHGWNFRAVFKRDRKGTLLDKDGKRGRRRRPAEVQEGACT